MVNRLRVKLAANAIKARYADEPHRLVLSLPTDSREEYELARRGGTAGRVYGGAIGGILLPVSTYRSLKVLEEAGGQKLPGALKGLAIAASLPMGLLSGSSIGRLVGSSIGRNIGAHKHYWNRKSEE